jgi:hypothetical protein
MSCWVGLCTDKGLIMSRNLFIISLLLFTIASCSGKINVAPDSPTPISPPQNSAQSAPSGGTVDRLSPSDRVPRISIDELFKKLNSSEPILIVDSRVDVNDQFSVGHIKGAIPVPLAKVISGEWMPPSDKNVEIVFYCT